MRRHLSVAAAAVAAFVMLGLVGLASADPQNSYPSPTPPLSSNPVTGIPGVQNGSTVSVSSDDLTTAAVAAAAPAVLQNPSGLVVGSATGGAQGVGTINAQGYYLNGVLVPSPGHVTNWTATQTFTGGAAIPGLGPTPCVGANSGGVLIAGSCPTVSVQAPFVGGSTGSVGPAPSQVASAANGGAAFGDSITAGVGVASPSTQGYAALLNADVFQNVGTFTNYGVSGYFVADINASMFTHLARPSETSNPIVTTLVGTNDAGQSLTSGYQTAYNQLFLATHAAAALSSTNTVLGGATTQAGTWSADSTYTNFAGIKSTTNGSTSAIATAYTPTGVFYVFFGDYISSGGTFTVSVDGTPATDTVTGLTTLTSQPATALGSNTSPAETVGLARFVTTAGTHAITITVTSTTNASNKVSILALGFPPAIRERGITAPKVFAGGVIRQAADANGTNSAIINGLNQADVTTLQNDGLDVTFVDVRSYVNITLDMQSTTAQGCTGSTLAPVHPGTCGHRHIAQAFEDAINPISPLFGTPVFNAPLNFSSTPTPATLIASNGGSADTGATTIPKATLCISTGFGFCWGVTMTSASAAGPGGGGFDTVAVTNSGGNGRFALSAAPGTATEATIAADEFAWFNGTGAFQIGTESGAPASDASGNFSATSVSASGFTASGSAGVNCSANTVNLTTLVVRNGIVVHC